MKLRERRHKNSGDQRPSSLPAWRSSSGTEPTQSPSPSQSSNSAANSLLHRLSSPPALLTRLSTPISQCCKKLTQIERLAHPNRPKTMGRAHLGARERHPPRDLLSRIELGTRPPSLTSPCPSEPESILASSHGQRTTFSEVSPCAPGLKQQYTSSENMQLTRNLQSPTCLTPMERPSSPTASGSMCSLEELSTSTMCSQADTLQDKMRSTLKSWERLNSRTEPLSPLRKSSPLGTGFSHGTRLSPQSVTHSHIGVRNSPYMESTSQICSERWPHLSTTGSSTSIMRSGSEQVQGETCSSRTMPTSQISKCNSWIHQERMSTRKRKLSVADLSPLQVTAKRRHANDGILEIVPPKLQHADTGMFAQPVGQLGTPQANALRVRPSSYVDASRPRYLRGLQWSVHGRRMVTSADASLTQLPLPGVPEKERMNATVNSTLASHPHLFKIVTPINVDHFQYLLRDHPNPVFVQSVLRGLREGFWPWATPPPEGYPSTWDEDRGVPDDEEAAKFLEIQRDEEVRLGRYSEAFGTDLLPGMVCMPIHAVPKPRSVNLRLVNDHSAGPYALNSLISPDAIKGVILDGIPALGEALREYRRQHGNKQLVMWKSDVSQAYRRLPMSIFWQIKQVTTIAGQRHVDRCNLFGSRGAQRIYAAFMCLVVWIAVVKRAIDHLNYVDDDFGFEEEGRVEFYQPYGIYLPTKQAQLLLLWDEIGLPHERKKQEYGPTLMVIGFIVDPNAMTVTLPDDSRQKLFETIDNFCHSPGIHRRRSLADFQSLAGYANWAFNVYPLLKPGLCNLYAKIAGKENHHAGMFVNASIKRELTWMSNHIKHSDGVHLLNALEWGPPDLVEGAPDDEFALVDASGVGLGLYFPWLNFGFYSKLPCRAPKDAIFYFEALAICSAIHRVAAWRTVNRSVRRLAVLSDNTNAVSLFNTLRAKPAYNLLLISSVDILIHDNLQLCVDHVPGEDNCVADALSRGQLDKARSLAPGIQLFPFTPP
ncbi:hypothetical protein A0H81_03642 [Grifola frondosa]|uniref:Reverse transcriptase domain-containing protein n=1 Tax=Grifola frondosa TaxID=5627 RepID=A0A1C7MHI9_GRIFR|nr:hypothetical protein A0H81_03642 [Grifola frondosa]